MGPITGVMKCVCLSLMDAGAASGVEDIDVHAFMASEAGAQLAKADPHGLDAGEAGVLYITEESDFYLTLNRLLRTRGRSTLKPFFPYLQLMLTARNKLPKYTGSVWRRQGRRPARPVPQGQGGLVVGLLVDDQAAADADEPTVPRHQACTVFLIEIVHGVDLQHYSAFQGEASEVEVLLYPGTKLHLVGSMEMGGGLFQGILPNSTMAVIGG